MDSVNFPTEFYRATDELNTYEKHVNAPYIRKEYELRDAKEVKILVSGLGFYDIWFNGMKITKGYLAPYISNPDHYVYFDEYDVTELAYTGMNAVGLILGNGMQNCPGGRVWDFDIAKFRGAPRFALKLSVRYKDGTEEEYDADTSYKCFPSPFVFDDLRSGVIYDARLEKEGWNEPGFDDSEWCSVKKAETPRGEFKICEAEPVTRRDEIKPVSIEKRILCEAFDNRENMRLDTQYKFDFRGKEGTMFDFGVNSAGFFRLQVKGEKDQQIFIQFCEHMTTYGQPSYLSTGSFYPDGYGQVCLYTCKGDGEEIFIPNFAYFGYRYAVVFGLKEEQISPDTLTMLVASSNFRTIGSFSCSDEVMNKLGRMARVSDLANFFYFPTDCPHREKNGWTGDAAVSAEHMLLTLTCENSYREWLRNICKAQTVSGALPGIIPTGGWGYHWGNGPAWDNVLTELCWQIYHMRGDLEPAKECSESMLRYLSYISGRRNEDGLVCFGLGDWLQPMRDSGNPVCPLEVTDSVISMYICRKSSDLFDALGMKLQKNFADELYAELRKAFRDKWIDFNTMTVKARCETAQAICMYYNVFDVSEKPLAGKALVEIIHEKGDHVDCGMIGLRVIFHVLSDIGEGSLAYKMITREDFPSYGNFIKRGLTSMPEDFLPENEWDRPNSLNHHFFGDIVSWFIQKVVGIRVNPRMKSAYDFDIKPDFIEGLDNAEAFYAVPGGRLNVSWKKTETGIILDVDCPDTVTGNIVLPAGFVFKGERQWRGIDQTSITKLKAGTYSVVSC